MKKAVNFRLKPETLVLLTMLEQKLHISKTEIVQQALDFYAKKELSNKNDILSYAGVLSEHESVQMLELIKSSKYNKTIKAKL